VDGFVIFAPLIVIAIVFAVQDAEVDLGINRLEGDFHSAETMNALAGASREEALHARENVGCRYCHVSKAVYRIHPGNFSDLIVPRILDDAESIDPQERQT
jgi:hypothetical protein